MYLMLSSNLRGGLSFASQRYAESSSFKQKGNDRIDSQQEILIDIDANK